MQFGLVLSLPEGVVGVRGFWLQQRSRAWAVVWASAGAVAWAAIGFVVWAAVWVTVLVLWLIWLLLPWIWIPELAPGGLGVWVRYGLGMMVTAAGFDRVSPCWAVSVGVVGGAAGGGARRGPGVTVLVWAAVVCMFMPGMVVRVGGPLCGGEAGGMLEEGLVPLPLPGLGPLGLVLPLPW